MNEAAKPKRTRRPAEEIRAEKIKAIDAKIASKREEIALLEQKKAELQKPPRLGGGELQSFLQGKVSEGKLSKEEAYMLGLTR